MVVIRAMESQNDQSDTKLKLHEQWRFYDSEVDAQSSESDEFLSVKEEAKHEEENTYFEQEVRL